MWTLIYSLQTYWADRTGYYASGNMFIHYDPHNKSASEPTRNSGGLSRRSTSSKRIGVALENSTKHTAGDVPGARTGIGSSRALSHAALGFFGPGLNG